MADVKSENRLSLTILEREMHNGRLQRQPHDHGCMIKVEHFLFFFVGYEMLSMSISASGSRIKYVSELAYYSLIIEWVWIGRDHCRSAISVQLSSIE